MYVIAGVTGKTGSAAANRLIERGEKVRVIVRKASQGQPWAERGAEVAVASLTNPSQLSAALQGAKGAYLLQPANYGSTQVLAELAEITASIHAALERTPVDRLVVLSSVGAHNAEGTGPIRGLYHLEQVLGPRQGRTFLRPSYFMENWGMSLGPAAEQGQIFSFFPPEVAFPMVSTLDVGRAAADLLLRPDPPAVAQLQGPKEYNANDVAAALGQLMKREVEPVVIAAEQTVATLQAVGVSTDMAELYKEMNAGVANGAVAFAGSEFPLRGATTLQQALAAML